MASGTTGATSTYSEGRGFSFAKDIASRIVDAAEAAKKEKKHQQKIIADGGTVPEKDKKGLFVKALKQEFITNPVNDLKKSFNKKIDKVGRVVGLFGSKGEKIQQKLSGKKLKTKGGFDRSGYQYAEKDEDSGGTGGGAGGSGSLVSSLGDIVLDIQQIAAAVSSMQGLIATQMNLSVKMSDSLEQIKSILTEQISLQQEQLNDEEMAARESSLESSQQTSGTSKATSTFNDPALAGLNILEMLGQLGNLFNIIKSLPSMFMNLLKGIISKIPGGKFLMQKFGGGAAKKVAGETVEAGAKGLLGKILRPIFKRIPIIGGLIDFAVSLALGEPVGRAAAKAAGATLGGALGGLIGSILPGPGTFVGGLLGGIAGDWVGGSLYDTIAGAFGGDEEKKMAQGGGVMVADAGPELVTGLHSADAKKQLGGNKGIGDVQDTYYSALAGSTLAITKDFIEGLGPVGQAVAPVIQDEVSKLGREFDLPATSTKVSVGGMGLRADPQAAKKGQNYLSELVKGTLEKLTGDKKKKDKKKGSSSSGGDSGSGSPSSTPANNNQPTGGGKSDFTFGDSIASGLVGRQGANQQTVMDASGVSKVGASPADVLGQLQSFDKTKLKGKVVRLSSGITNNPSDLKSVEEQIKYLVSVGAKVQLVGVTNTPPKIGTYKHLEKPLTGMNDKLSALAAKYSDKGVSFLGGFTPGSDGIHPSNASELNTKFNVDVLPGGQVGAAKGYSGAIQYFSNNGGGNQILEPGKTYSFKDLRMHHGNAANSAKRTYGYPKDYTVLTGPDLTAPNAPIPTPLDGTIVEKIPTPGGGYGNHVVIDTSVGKMLFAHFSKFGNIKKGEKVSAGTILGVQGNTGKAGMEDHLHIDAEPAGHEAFINFITSGKAVHGGVSNGDEDSEDETSSEGEPDVDPFTALEKAFSGILTGAAMLRKGASYTSKEQFDEDTKAFEQVFKPQPTTTTGANPTATPSGSTTTPTSSQPASTKSQLVGGGNTGVTRPSGTPSIVQMPSGAPTVPTSSLSRNPRPEGSTANTYRPRVPT